VKFLQPVLSDLVLSDKKPRHFNSAHHVHGKGTCSNWRIKTAGVHNAAGRICNPYTRLQGRGKLEKKMEAGVNRRGGLLRAPRAPASPGAFGLDWVDFPPIGLDHLWLDGVDSGRWDFVDRGRCTVLEVTKSSRNSAGRREPVAFLSIAGAI